MAVIREAGVEIEGIPAEIGTEDGGENIGKQKDDKMWRGTSSRSDLRLYLSFKSS